MKRQLAFTASVGSTNYNTNDEYSDVDKKTYEFPTFDDLYHKRDWSKGRKDESGDVEFHDIRKLGEMLYKSNINFVELLFSQSFEQNHWVFHELIQIREDIARMNLPYLFDACMGMIHRTRKLIERDSKIVDAWGANGHVEIKRKVGKEIATMYRVADFLIRYHDNQFYSFANAVRYKNDEDARFIILSMRKGEWDYKEILELAEKHVQKADILRATYKSKFIDEDTHAKVEELIYQAVEEIITAELKGAYQ